jgi:hypothetical protein
MDKADLAALLEAHGGRAQPVASLHVLRSPALGEDEQAFLVEHQAELATIDLSRWLNLAERAQRPAVLDALAAFAVREPGRFELEIARAPHFQLDDAELEGLARRLQGRVPTTLIASLESPGIIYDTPPTKRSVPPPPGPLTPRDEMFDPGELLGGMDFDLDSGALGGGALGGDTLGSLGGLLDDDGGSLGGLLDGDGGGDLGGGFFEAPPPPLLGALLADVSMLNTKRARTVWRARARALAADPAEDWSRAVTRLPAAMADAVTLRATTSPRPAERATLLEWMIQNGARRAQLVDASLSLLSLEPKDESVSQWLGHSFFPRVLADKAAWQKHGVTVLATLAARRAFGEMDQLFTSAATGAGAFGPGGGNGALRGPAFAALSSTLLAQSGAAVAAGRVKEAAAYAASLASIGFPSRQGKAVASLRRKRGAKGDVARLLGVARPRGPKDLPQLEAFIAAVHVLSEAL